MSDGKIEMREVVHPRERVWFAVCALAALATVAIAALAAIDLLAVVLGLTLLSLLLTGFSLGQLRANAVRVDPRQLATLHALAERLSERLALKRVPAIYVLQEGGALNAFAARWLRRDLVVLYSDVVALADDGDEDALAFVLAHELTHVRRRHALWAHLLRPAMLVPGIYSAWSRACEYTCDRAAAELVPGGAPAGLLVLAAGRRLHRRVDPAVYAAQAHTERGFWVSVAELVATHPHLPKRVAAIQQLAQAELAPPAVAA